MQCSPLLCLPDSSIIRRCHAVQIEALFEGTERRQEALYHIRTTQG